LSEIQLLTLFVVVIIGIGVLAVVIIGIDVQGTQLNLFAYVLY
jgi:hypothetical protein